MSGVTTAVQVEAGGYNYSHHTCARLSDGTLRCWGEGANGQLGDGTVLVQSTPVSVSGMSTATQVSSGTSHSCARLSDSTIKCWGLNRDGQIGDGTTTDRATPTAVTGISNAVQVSAGDKYTCAVLSDGTVKCWGSNAHGHFSDTGPEIQPTPVAITGITTATQVSAGEWHACARLSDSTLRCWGLNGNGQLGDGTTLDKWGTPTAVSGITTATQVAAGKFHSCARLSDGTLKCWGDNYYGQLGAGLVGGQTTPISVSGIVNATHVSAGGESGIDSGHSCARLADSTLRCWGENFQGELGDGTTTHRSTPVAVSGVTSATDISAGFAITCAPHSDGTLRCWGNNGGGQLGDGTTTNRLTPAGVSGISNGVQVSAATNACARLSDNTVKCWGYAYGGRLGNGVLGYSLVPVTVALGGGGGPQPPTITTTTLPGGTVNQVYSQSVTATGGTTPYTWSLTAGALPPGLSLSATGTPSATISGTPVTVGTYNLTVRVFDGASLTDTQDLSITIAPPPSPVPNPQTLDDFNRPVESPVLQAGNWSTTGITGGPGAPLSQNRLRNFPSPAGGYSYRVTPYPGGEVDAAAKVVTRPSTNHYLSVFICLQQAGTPGWDGYELRAKVLSGTDLWEIRRVDNGNSNVIASTNLEIATNGTMLLRRWGGDLEFWWKPLSGTWSKKASVASTAYMWGTIGAGGFSTGALDDFGGGSLLTLLDQYAPELRYFGTETYRADAADVATNLWHASPYRTNELKHLGSGESYAAADPASPLDDLSLTYLSTQAFPFDYLSQPDWWVDDVEQAQIDYTTWVALHPEHRRRAYGRVVPGGSGEKILQYWFYYYYNPYDPSGIGNHEGDWEFYQVRLDNKNVPKEVSVSQHGAGEKCDWGSDVTLASSGRPAMYVAYESHANYFWPGTHHRNNLPDDITEDAGVQYREVPTVTDVTSPPGWIMWNGQWGDSTGQGTGSPKSPGAQTDQWDAWAFHGNAGACTEPPPSPLRLRAQGPSASAAPGAEGKPPLAKIKAAKLVPTKIGRALRVHYCFASLPTAPSRRPTRLHITVENRQDSLPPLTTGWRITKRCNTVLHHLGPIKPPYVFTYAVQSRTGTWSKRVPIRVS